MAGIRLLPEESDISQQQQQARATVDLVSDDERSVAADSWSIKSEYGSTLDDDQRHADAAEDLSSANFRASSDYNSDKEEPDEEGVASMLGLHSYWDAAYAEELANFREHGHSGEVWFGADVMESVASWTKSLCIEISQGQMANHVDETNSEAGKEGDKFLSGWSVLDIGTGNGLLLQELAKQVDDILETKIERQFQLVMDKGTLDAIGLHPDGPLKRIMYWDSVSKLVAPGGILVITSCNNTKDELVQAMNINQRKIEVAQEPDQEEASRESPFRYLNHVRTYPTFMFGGQEGSRVATVAFIRN